MPPRKTTARTPRLKKTQRPAEEPQPPRGAIPQRAHYKPESLRVLILDGKADHIRGRLLKQLASYPRILPEVAAVLGPPTDWMHLVSTRLRNIGYQVFTNDGGVIPPEFRYDGANPPDIVFNLGEVYHDYPYLLVEHAHDEEWAYYRTGSHGDSAEKFVYLQPVMEWGPAFIMEDRVSASPSWDRGLIPYVQILPPDSLDRDFISSEWIQELPQLIQVVSNPLADSFRFPLIEHWLRSWMFVAEAHRKREWESSIDLLTPDC